jgi:hypothetical protein
MARRLATGSFWLLLALAAACASGPRSPYDEDGPREVELHVFNDRMSTVTAYVQWRRTAPMRLSEIEGGRSFTTRVPLRGQELRVFFVNPGRSPGDPRIPEYAPARAGDRFEWRLLANGNIFYMRLES